MLYLLLAVAVLLLGVIVFTVARLVVLRHRALHTPKAGYTPPDPAALAESETEQDTTS